MGKFIFHAFAEDGLRDLANSVNGLLLRTMRLIAWQTVLSKCNSASERNFIVFNFIQVEAEGALILPYSIRNRFYFAAAHTSHSANKIVCSDLNYSDDIDNLPNDASITHNLASKPMKYWRKSKTLSKKLNQLNSTEYREATSDFRNKFTHRYSPGIEIGGSRSMSRGFTNEEVNYSFGLADCVKLENIIVALQDECIHFRAAFTAFEALVVEQVEKVDSFLLTKD